MALPVQWSDKTVTVGARSYDAATHVPSFVYPSCFSDYDVLGHYVVVNSVSTLQCTLSNPHPV